MARLHDAGEAAAGPEPLDVAAQARGATVSGWPSTGADAAAGCGVAGTVRERHHSAASQARIRSPQARLAVRSPRATARRTDRASTRMRSATSRRGEDRSGLEVVERGVGTVRHRLLTADVARCVNPAPCVFGRPQLGRDQERRHPTNAPPIHELVAARAARERKNRP